LAPSARAATAGEVADALVALHATDPATVHLAVAARTGQVTAADVEAALYDERTLMRMLGMRRTLFVVPDEVAPVVQAACTRALVVKERASLLKLLHEQDSRYDAAWLSDLEDHVHQLLLDKGPATGAELSAAEPRLRTQVTYAPGKSYSQTGSITTRVLSVLAAEGRIVRGRPAGSWISSKYQWSAVEQWLPGGMPDLPLAEAQAELARRWLGAFGPGTAADLKWWAGWTMGATKAALAAVGAVEVELEGGSVGYVLPGDEGEEGDEEVAAEVEPWAALLPALDPTAMGWAEREWYLSDDASKALFDRTGNLGPTIWWNGAVVGGWAQRPDGEVVIRLLQNLDGDAVRAIHAERDRLSTWLGSSRVTPRFRTPLERELSGA
jgi:hypothetical protein